MRLILLPLLGLLLVGDALENFRPSGSITYILLTPRDFQRVRSAQQMMRRGNRQGMPSYGMGGRQPSVVNQHSMRFPSIKPPTMVHQNSNTGFGIANKPLQSGQAFSPSNSGHSQNPSTLFHGHNPSSPDQANKISGVNDKPSNTLYQEPKPSVSHQEHKPNVENTFKPPSFNPNHEPFSSQDFKPSSFEERKKPSNSDEDSKHSSFGEDEKHFDKEMQTSFFDEQGSHPNRNPVCNITPDSGTCRAALPRYYLDPETGTCNCYLYGGCTEDGEGESPGSFFTLEECQQACHPPNMEEGPVCKDIFKEDQFISYLVDRPPPKKAEYLNDADPLTLFN